MTSVVLIAERRSRLEQLPSGSLRSTQGQKNQENWFECKMTDGGKMARRSARVFADEYQPSQEKSLREGGHIPTSRERDEKQIELEKSRSRGSSCSSTSLVNFEMDMYAEVASNDSSQNGTPGPDSVGILKEKIKGRPVNFGTVLPGFYRSGYPQTEDHEYLKSLGLRTIVTLVQKDYPEGYQLFMESNGIKHIVVDIQGTKKVNIPFAVMKSVMEIALDRRNYPILMHCNHGKHRTGCVVAIIRKALGWRVDAIIEEYTTYAYPKTRESDMKYIHGFEVKDLSQVFREPGKDMNSEVTFSGTVSRARIMKMVAMAILMLTLWAFATVQLRP